MPARSVDSIFVTCTVFFLMLTFAPGPLAVGIDLSETDLLAGADTRIEKHRKADLHITIVDAAGKPVPDAEVRVRQTRHAFLFGCNIYMWGRLGDETVEADYRQRFANLFNYATLAFYWPSYERQRGQPDHRRTEQIATWCKDHGIAVKGHPLAWNFADPAWLPSDPDEILTLQLARIEDCVSRFKGLIDRWDVVNEATHFDRDQFRKRAPKLTGMWEKTGRVEFTRMCFSRARNTNPDATLLINDYRVDPDYETLIKQLVDDDGRRMYDVIGIQSHMHGGPWPNRKIWDVCERFARFGVPLHFTEATILSGIQGWHLGSKSKPWSSTPDGEARQARKVKRFYTMLFSRPAVEAITWWDFSDRGAWQQAPAGLVRKDMSPKPAYDTLTGLIKGKWWTTAMLKTGAAGNATCRTFLGNYEITVTAPGKSPVTKTMTIEKGKTNRLRLALQ